MACICVSPFQSRFSSSFASCTQQQQSIAYTSPASIRSKPPLVLTYHRFLSHPRHVITQLELLPEPKSHTLRPYLCRRRHHDRLRRTSLLWMVPWAKRGASRSRPGRGLTRSRSLPPYLSPPPLYSAPDRVSRTILPVESTFLRYFSDLPLFPGFPSIARFYFIRRNGGTFLSSASAFDPSRGGNDWARLYAGSGRRSGGRDYIDPGERPEIWDAALPNVAVSSTEKEKKGEMAGWVEVASEKAKANDSATPWWISPNNTLVSLFRFSLSLACLLLLALRREGAEACGKPFLSGLPYHGRALLVACAHASLITRERTGRGRRSSQPYPAPPLAIPWLSL